MTQYLLEKTDGNRVSITHQQYDLLKLRKDVMHLINTPQVKVLASAKTGPTAPKREYPMGGGRLRNPYASLATNRHGAREVGAKHW